MMLPTLRQSLQYAEEILVRFGIEEARKTAQLLVQCATGCTMLDILRQPKMQLSQTQWEQLQRVIHRRVVKREPIQYMMGTVEFYGLELTVSDAVLIPRPETEDLVTLLVHAFRCTKWQPRYILDIGTGSGCIALALAKAFPSSCVIGLDNNEESLTLAASNAFRNNIKNVEWRCADIFTDIKLDTPMDLVVSNPPYISNSEYEMLSIELHHEPYHALCDGADGLSFFRRYAQIFPALLSEQGMFALECGWNQASTIRQILCNWSLVITCDYQGYERYIWGGMCQSKLNVMYPYLANGLHNVVDLKSK